MKKLALIFVLLLTFSIQAQDDTTASASNEVTERYVLRVFGDSVFIRGLPTRESDPVGSAFENDSLWAVGRNADGSWFEVRRPGREVNAGWISKDWVSYTFEVGQLPITDFEAGVIGPEPVFDSGFSVFVLTEATLRNRPSVRGEEIMTIPIGLTIPGFERSPDNLWVHVNYLGTTGWVAEFLMRPSADINTLVVSPEFAVTSVPVEIIPVEVQLAQVSRLRDFITPKRDLAETVANFWSLVIEREVVPCNPPGGGLEHFPLSARDVIELPELRRYTRRITTAVNDLNASIETMQRCGVYNEDELSTAFAQSVNARIIFDATLGALRNIEDNVILRSP